MRKLLVSLLVFFIVIVLGLFISVRFFPKVYVSVFNHYSNEKIIVNSLNVRFLPLSVKANGFEFSDSKGEKLVSANDLSFSAQVIAWFQGKPNFWKAKLATADIQLNKFPAGSDEAKSDDSSLEKLNVHKVLSSLNLQADEVRVQLNEHSYVRLNRFKTNLNKSDLSDYTLIEQDVGFSLDYVTLDDVEKTLSVDGVFQSTIESGVSKLKVDIVQIDLSPMLGSADPSAKDADVTSKGNSDESIAEEEVDWQWLSQLDPLELDLTVGSILWSKSSVRDLSFVLKLDESIGFTQRANVAWFDSSDMSFEDDIVLSGHLKPISLSSLGADLRGQIDLKAADSSLSIDGDFNVNGLEGNAVSIELDSAEVPVKSDLLDEKTLALIKQYFPLKAAVDVGQVNGVTNLDFNNLQFGNSDFKGTVELNTKQSGLVDINAQLQSNVVSFTSPEPQKPNISSKTKRELMDLPVVVEGEETQLVESVDNKESTSSNKERVFSDQTIDFSWLDSLALDINWQAKKVIVDNIEVTDLILPLSISEGALALNDVSGDIAGGSFKVKSNLVKREESGAISVNLETTDVDLEQLNLLPPEELKEAILNMSVELTTKGNSPHALASSLNGVVDLKVGEGVIGNDAFELIGSDLLFTLLNKLNPFSKEDKTTELECAVVNLRIDDGKIDIDKSLALRTSKLTVVANGYVDLGAEKIKIGLTPKARSGVGVDVSSLVKFIALGGTLSKPAPTVTASGLLKSAVVVGAAVSTGGVSLLATSAAEKTIGNVDVCKRATNAFK